MSLNTQVIVVHNYVTHYKCTKMMCYFIRIRSDCLSNRSNNKTEKVVQQATLPYHLILNASGRTVLSETRQKVRFGTCIHFVHGLTVFIHFYCVHSTTST